MTTTTTPAGIRWVPAGDGGFTGYVGTVEAFRIAPSGEGENWTWHLTSSLPGQQDDHGWAMDPIVSKVTAEEWHGTYLSGRPYVAAALAALRTEIESYRDAHRTRAGDLTDEGKDPATATALARELDWVLAAMARMEAGQ